MTELSIKPIGKYIDQLNGFAFKSELFNQDDSGIRLCRGINITRGKLRFDSTNEMYWNDESIDLKKYLLDQGDIVISMDGSLVGRNFAIVQNDDLPLLLVQRVARLRAKEGLSQGFLYQWIASDHFIKYVDSVKTSSGIPHISASQINEFKITFPPFQEQQKIASILSKWDETIEAQTQLIEAKEKQKKGLMQKLLTGELRFPGFDDEWEFDSIGNILKIRTGKKDTQNKEEYGEYPFFVRSNYVERINSFSFDGESVLTSGDGVGVGKIFHYINGKFDYHQRVYNIHGFNEKIDGRYFYYYFSNHFFQRVMSMTAKNSVDSVRMEMISDMLIPIPSIDEQKKVATFLTCTDNEIQSLKIELEAMKLQKKGLMQELLTGKIRVTA